MLLYRGWLRHRDYPCDIRYPSLTAWTTRVSNPFAPPRFRAQRQYRSTGTLATDVPPDIRWISPHLEFATLPGFKSRSIKGRSTALEPWDFKFPNLHNSLRALYACVI